MANTILKQNLKEMLSGTAEFFLEKYNNSQWPTPENEEWRRTNLVKYNLSGFNLKPELEGYHYLVTNGEVKEDFSIYIKKVNDQAASISFNENVPEGVLIIDPLNPVQTNDNTLRLISESINYAAKISDNKTEYLSLSNFDNSLFIIIPDNYSLEKPILVEFHGHGGDTAFLPNLFVITGENAELKLIQKIETPEGSNISGILTVMGGVNSNIQTAAISDVGDGSIIFINRFFRLLENTFLSDFQSHSGGELIKAKTEVSLLEEKADARLYGIVMAEEKNHIDLRTIQYHKGKDCFSQAQIKSVVSDRGRSIYQGLIEVEEDASLTDAYLTNHNLVLNNGARADSIPSLKIRNNDVKCSHGSTTGKINEEQILYLTSRGIERVEAKHMILEGFLGSVYDQLSDEISSYSSPFILDKLKTEGDS